MRNAMMIIIISGLLAINACSTQPSEASVADNLRSKGIHLNEFNSSAKPELNSIKSTSYKLDNDEILIIYDFGSVEKREQGLKLFQEHQQILSSHAPIVYQTAQSLTLYYSKVASNTQTPKHNETKYGEDIQKALKSM